MVEEKEEIKEEESKNVREARSEFEKLKEINDATEQELLRKEELRAQLNLMGKAEAGKEQLKTEEQLKKDGALEFFKGTEIAKAIEKHG